MPPPPLPSLSSASQDPHVPKSVSAYAAMTLPGLAAPALSLKPPKPPPHVTNARLKDPSTLSGFKSLQSLSVLDMDSLDYLSELAICVRNSTSSLKKLKLSLSEPLAMRARKPVLDDSDDSDQEIDQFNQLVIQSATNLPPPPPPPPPVQEGPQEKEARIRAERSSQEAVLGKVFGLEKLPSEAKKELKKNNATSEAAKKAANIEKARKEFENQVKSATMAILAASKMPTTVVSDTKREPKEVVHEAAELLTDAYVKWLSGPAVASESLASSSKQTVSSSSSSTSPPVVEGKGKGKEVALNLDVTSAPSNNGTLDASPDRPKATGSAATLANGSSSKHEGDPNPSDGAVSLFNQSESRVSSSAPKPDPDLAAIDLEHPDAVEDDDLEDQEAVAEIEGGQDLKSLHLPVEKKEESSIPFKAPAEHKNGVEPPAGKKAQQTAIIGSNGISNIMMSGGLDVSEMEPDKNDKNLSTPPDKALKDYVRSTRKLPLDTLSLYLIPVKASVLSRAVDLAVLRRITLLNVGPQAPFWTTMSNLNRAQPLSLEYIHTDNVTPKFLSLVNSLPKLSEIYLLERCSVTKVESLAGKTTAGIEEIRKQILKPHLRTLKKIMIKNDDSYAWDVDVKAMKLITKRGKGLLELAVSMGLRSFVSVLQPMPLPSANFVPLSIYCSNIFLD